ncbi:MAG TPA: hypothetical protein VFF72_01970, partial [Caldimonas sp.]|nr:hypothetical protein [Caldimonas sp.]
MAMDRLLMLDLAAGGCAVEAHLNGMPVASLAASGGSCSVAVHEYTLAGRNHLSLVVGPAPPGVTVASQPKVAIGATWARARLVLVRHGQSPADPEARVLGVVEWTTAEGKSYDAPSTHGRDVDLPVSFPRWRWLDAPPIAINTSVQRTVLEFMQNVAVELGRGNPDPLVAASKLRFDELALAYQTDANAGMQRFRDHLQRLYAAKALKVPPPAAADLVLRPLVDGRLLECLAATGGPLLRTQNDAPDLGDQAWPVRIAMVEGKIYVLR